MSNEVTSKRKMTLRAFALAGAAISVVAVAALSANAQAPRLLSPPLAADGTLSFADLVERVSPAVVSILVEREVRGPQLPSVLEEFYRFRFGQPDDGFGGNPFSEEPRRMEAQGSGFFVDADGHIVTNNHVIDGADAIEVRLANGDVLKAELVGADPLTDLAVLKVDAKKGQAFVEFSDDVNLRVGDWVVAVGNPFGLSGTVTSGIVSAIGGQGRNSQYLDFIQIDAPINRGNSGGPTFDLKGRVVGVNTAIYSTTGGSVGIGFAIPAKVAKETVSQLIKNGSVVRGWLGVSIQPVTTEIAAALGRKEAKGALISEVIEGTPAAEAGFESGDLVVSFNGDEIEDPVDLTRRVAALAPGSNATARVVRDGANKTINVKIGQREGVDGVSRPSESSGGGDSLTDDLGLRVAEISPAMREQFRIPDDVDGVVVTGVRRGSKAEAAGLRAGAVILKVDGKTATSASGLRGLVRDAINAGKEAVLMHFQIGDAKQFGALTLSDD